MKQKRLFYLCLILTLVWIVVIYAYSAQPADESSQNSSGIVETLIQILYPDYEELSPLEQLKLKNDLTWLVRKSAHAAEYAILAILIYITCVISNLKWAHQVKIWMALACSIVYAATDEIHQLFVEGRSGQFTDVLVDTFGALIGILILQIIYQLIHRNKNISN